VVSVAYPEFEVVSTNALRVRSSAHRSAKSAATPRAREVVGVAVEGPVRRLWRTIVYWVRLCLLTLFGPATLDEEHDPIVQLKREHVQQSGRG
jgi:hypothetical protein